MRRPTPESIEGDIVALDVMDSRALRQRWREVYGTEPPPKIQSGLLRLAVAYRVQERAFGGLKPAAKRQMREHLSTMAGAPMTDGGRKRSKVTRLTPGTQLMREWNGSTVIIEVVADGFRWKDQTYRTLSAVAVAITGTKWSGPKFFGLTAADANKRRLSRAGAP